MRDHSNIDILSRQEENKLSGSPESVAKENPIKHFDMYGRKELIAVNYILYCHGRGIPLKDSIGCLATRAGVSVSTFARVKAKLVAAGFITSFRSFCFGLCTITVSTFFLKRWVRVSLSYFFPALKMLPFISLLSVQLEALARKQISPQIGYIKPTSRKFDRHINTKDIYKENYIPSYVTNVQNQTSSSPFTSSSQSVKKDCSMSGILSRLCDKLAQGVKVEPVRHKQATHRAMLEQEVFKITEVPLTKWGQIRFCAFPAHIISRARLSYDKTLTGQEAFNSLFSQALTHCRKQNIEPDWKRVHYLATFFKQPPNAPMVLNANRRPVEDDTPPLRDERQTPRTHKRKSTSSYAKATKDRNDPHANSHKREAYKPWNESEKNKRAAEPIYVAYFTVVEGYKKSGNPLGFPNPYKEKYIQYLNDAIQASGVTKEQIEAELYNLYKTHKEKK